MELAKAKALKIGDVVCDCRCKHLRVAEIVHGEYDADLVLEDGSSCSAVHCCDVVPHIWAHSLDVLCQQFMKDFDFVRLQWDGEELTAFVSNGEPFGRSEHIPDLDSPIWVAWGELEHRFQLENIQRKTIELM